MHVPNPSYRNTDKSVYREKLSVELNVTTWNAVKVSCGPPVVVFFQDNLCYQGLSINMYTLRGPNYIYGHSFTNYPGSGIQRYTEGRDGEDTQVIYFYLALAIMWRIALRRRSGLHCFTCYNIIGMCVCCAWKCWFDGYGVTQRRGVVWLWVGMWSLVRSIMRFMTPFGLWVLFPAHFHGQVKMVTRSGLGSGLCLGWLYESLYGMGGWLHDPTWGSLFALPSWPAQTPLE